jgi:AcrR family transcriptional regulator
MDRQVSREDRVLDAALVCIARVGLAKTTLDDVAREAGCARATVYRVFGGKQQLLRALVAREALDFGRRVTGAAAAASTVADAVVSTVVEGATLLRSNAALTFVAAHEPEQLLPYLAFESDVLYAATPLLAPAYERFLGPELAARLAEWVARISLSDLCSPSDSLDLRDALEVRALVDDFILPGFTADIAEGVHP